jgi:hypothetical protein
MMYRLYCLLLLVFSLTITVYAQTKPLTNDDIVQMVKGGFDEQTIVKAIQAHGPAFTTSVEALVALKNAGVTKAVIDAMLDAETKNRSGLQPVPPKQEEAIKPPTASGPTREQAAKSEEWPAELAGMYREVGIYYKQDGKFVQLYGRPVVASQTGGFLKSSFTMGISKIRSKGEVPGKRAQLQVPTRQPDFYFYMAEGQLPDNFVVVRMEEKKDRREFQVGSFGGAAGGMSTGLELHKVNQLIIERVTSHVYRVRPDGELLDGEYGFLGSFVVLTAGMAGGGEKVYDFGIHMKKK